MVECWYERLGAVVVATHSVPGGVVALAGDVDWEGPVTRFKRDACSMSTGGMEGGRTSPS